MHLQWALNPNSLAQILNHPLTYSYYLSSGFWNNKKKILLFNKIADQVFSLKLQTSETQERIDLTPIQSLKRRKLLRWIKNEQISLKSEPDSVAKARDDWWR